ncbi:MAG: FAD:protein FMN transferase [Rhodospirillales bacterium]|nr:FAD:protein FMN transferase [Rhodospirillales bacterium]
MDMLSERKRPSPLPDPDVVRSKAALRDCIAEIARLEDVLSLYHPASALARLNARGALDAPPIELVEVLTAAERMSASSEGAFDVTVQPLWSVYVRAQREPGVSRSGCKRRAHIGWQRLRIAPDRVAFAAPGMAATLNGIAQGYAADRIAGRLRESGFAHVLADLGEYRALGGRTPGEAWRIGIGRPGDSDDLAATLALSDAALATSSPSGFRFDTIGERHHLFDPRTGRSATSWAQVSVIAPMPPPRTHSRPLLPSRRWTRLRACSRPAAAARRC